MSLSRSLLIRIIVGFGLALLVLLFVSCQKNTTNKSRKIAPRHPKALGKAQTSRVHIIEMGDTDGQHIFLPDRLRVKVGEKVRWINVSDGHSTTAYVPQNNMQYLSRIPVRAKPWDSGVLDKPNQTFDYTFNKEGVYQYYCTPHEGEGMVGTIVVGRTLKGPALAPIQKQIPAAAQDKLNKQIQWVR